MLNIWVQSNSKFMRKVKSNKFLRLTPFSPQGLFSFRLDFQKPQSVSTKMTWVKKTEPQTFPKKTYQGEGTLRYPRICEERCSVQKNAEWWNTLAAAVCGYECVYFINFYFVIDLL